MLKNWVNERLIPKFFHWKLREIERYRNLHIGEECYIWGDGISVKYFDLGLFSDKISIPCSHLPFHKDFHKLNVPYAFYIENLWFYPFTKNTSPPFNYLRNYIQKEYRSIIESRKDITFFLSWTNSPTIRENNVLYIHKRYNYLGLNSDLLPSVSAFEYFLGSIRGAIFLAYFMGFKKIYLLGFDYTHKNSSILHWYEKGEGLSKKIINYNSDFFNIMKDVIEIITVTLEGKAELLPSITYEELTSCVPHFRENTELLSEERMKILSTWPGYTIF